MFSEIVDTSKSKFMLVVFDILSINIWKNKKEFLFEKQRRICKCYEFENIVF